ncbi:hypothetical protein [Acidovorax sp. sic0104]|uniref:hypothetical protein n=1 Tax=Acidovorax sp. sic0104 TaxID=2854784 RepID=UPI001C436AFE|nr:hypothetical protein [Acidovorax sp. sic0104]MBV7541942.1 hypothetical protein [Acidovorax sp. sic0104]
MSNQPNALPATAPAVAGKQPVFVRAIADALERYLAKAETSVHWVCASGDANSWQRPVATWPEEEFLPVVAVMDGANEGSRIEVLFEPTRKSGVYKPLLRVKTLSGMRRAFEEAVHVHTFLRELDLDALREKSDLRSNELAVAA